MAIMSHGRGDGEVYANDGWIKIKELTDILSECKGYASKPKLLFIQVNYLSISFATFLYFVFSCILIPLSRESNQSAITSSLRSCRSPVYHFKMEKSR